MAVFTMRGEDDRVAQAIALTKPQAIVEAFHRCVVTDIDIVILRRRDRVGVPAILSQRRDGQRLVTMLLIDAEEPDRGGREQPVDGDLHVRAHVARKLPRGRDQLIPRDAGKMPGQGVAGVVE